jgi:hypothetical protein
MNTCIHFCTWEWMDREFPDREYHMKNFQPDAQSRGESFAMTSSPRPIGVSYPRHRSFTPEYSDTTGVIHKGQILANAPKRTLCIHFLVCYCYFQIFLLINMKRYYSSSGKYKCFISARLQFNEIDSMEQIHKSSWRLVLKVSHFHVYPLHRHRKQSIVQPDLLSPRYFRPLDGSHVINIMFVHFIITTPRNFPCLGE